MPPLLARLHSVVQEIFERTHDHLGMEAIAGTTALYQLAEKCWREIGYDSGDAEDNPVALLEAHEILTTAWVGIELRRAQLASTFPQAPLRSRTVGFPEYGSDPGFPLKVFLHMRKLKRWLAYTPLIPSLPSGSSAKAGSSDSRR
jgi:hypothetical protein